MSAEPTASELHRLFVAKADGTITPEEHDRLCALLKASSETRRAWFAFQDAESGLLAWSQREALRREQLVGFGMGGIERPFFGVTLGYAASLVAGIFIGFLAWAITWPEMGGSVAKTAPPAAEEATTSSVAVLARGVNMVWDRAGMVPAVNAPLSPGLLRLQSGVAEVEFFQGARLCIEGPAEISLVSSREAFCRYGRFSAHVPTQARGFRLGTPKGDIVDLGTDFGLNLSDASPELHVFKGEVELHQPRAQMRRLTEGAAVWLEQTGVPRPMVANASAFAFSRDLEARVIASQRMAFDRWRDAGARWNNEESLRMRLDFQDENGSRSVRNVAVHGRDVAGGTMVGCTWTEGRWPGKRALQFRSVSDRVRFSLPGEYQQITLAAWVQLHSLSTRQSQSSLCMSQGIEAGGMHWQILHDGSLCLGVISGSRPVLSDDYITPVVFTPEHFGQWVHLAVVCDVTGREVRHYVDGRVFSRHPLNRSVALKPGLAELGNWIPAPGYPGRHTVRNFVGCMDDFSLFSHALSDDEVRQLAE